MSPQSGRDLDLLLPEPLFGLTRSCEVECAAECCGTDAFDIDWRHLAPWFRENGRAKAILALSQMESLVGRVSRHSGRVRSAGPVFNAIWETSAECLNYLDR